MLFPRSNLSRREVVERVAYLKPQTSFRSAYAYSNILYVVAGQLIEDVSGMHWEDFVRERVLRPGGMKTATTRTTERVASANRSLPHARVSGLVRGLGPQHVLDENDGIAPNAGPAGGLAFSAKDQAAWVQIMLAGGSLPDGSILFSQVQAAELCKPVTIIPIGQLPESLKLAQPSYQAYALGWQVRDYRGHRMLTHSGSVSGAIARVVLLPDINIGFAIQMNSEDSGMLLGLTYKLLDHYLGLPEIGWIEEWQSWHESSLEAGHRELIKAQVKPVRARPSLSLARYTGRYRDPWYGDVVIGSDRHGLTVDFTTTPSMAGRLKHWQYDTFITELNDVTLERAYVTFVLDAEGKVASMAMKPVNPIVDFSWDYQDLELRPVEYAR
jgi:CubicO group peptidase (beta-lactamase class C family)